VTAFAPDELRAAIEQDQLFLLFQPQVDLVTGRPRGVEVMLRWQHPRLGVVHAAVFVRQMAPAGLDRHCLRWMLRTACRQLVDWRAGGTDVEYIALNAFAESLTPALAEDTARAMTDASLDPSSLEIECQPETIFDARAADGIRAVRATRVRVAFDDFGDGPLRLADIHALEFDTLKVPVPFVKTVGPLDDALISSTVAIGRAMGARVVAEGVETPVLRERVRVLGCDLGQGYLWSQLVRGAEIPSIFAGFSA
jgi:EAL domain-containing protein (putative c-di-GMP-specific phosphodiesterase class I)